MVAAVDHRRRTFHHRFIGLARHGLGDMSIALEMRLRFDCSAVSSVSADPGRLAGQRTPASWNSAFTLSLKR
jgi:hypothetical protein